MKILHVRASNFFGGPEKQILGHVLASRTRGIESLVCSFLERGREVQLVTQARAQGIVTSSVPCSSAYDPRQILYLRRLIKRETPDIVCTHEYRSTLLCFVALRGLRARQIAFSRGVTRENVKVSLYYRLESGILKAVDHVIAVSKEQYDFHTLHTLPVSRVSLVPNAVSVESGDWVGTGGSRANEKSEFLPAALSGKVKIAAAGRLSPEKGQNFLVEAMRKVLARRPDVVLLIFGEGPTRARLEKIALDSGSGDNIQFLGFVPDFASIVKETDIFVLPSLSEGLPNALLEAMAAGVPVVATRIGGVVDVVTDGVTGLLAPPGDSDGLAGALLKLLSDGELAKRLGSSARELMRQSYSFEKQSELLSRVYLKVLAGATE